MDSAALTKNRTLQLVILLLGALFVMFNIGVTNVAIPKIASALNANGVQIHFIANGTVMTLAAFVLLAGAIGDKFGRKKLFLAGAALMALSSVMSALSSNADILIFWRMVGGFATAMLFPTTLSMITTLYQEPKQRVMMIGLWSGITAAGAAIAPIVAGALLQYFPWGSVFLFSAPFLALAFILGFIFLSNIQPSDNHPIDWIGGGLSFVGIILLLYAIIVFPVDGLDSKFLILMGISIISIIGFVIRQKKTSFPLLDMSVFKNRRFSISSFTLILLAFAQLGVMFLAQQYLQNVLGYDSLNAGLAAFPMSLAVLISAPIAAKVDTRFGSKLPVTLGLLFTAVGFFSALFWTVTSPYEQVFVSYFLIGIGVGLAMTPCTNAIMNSVSKAKAGIGSAVNDVTRDLGNSLGVAINGTIAAVSYDAVLTKVYSGLPEGQKELVSNNIATTVTSSLTGALEVAKRYPSPDSAKLLEAAKQAFLHGQIEAMGLSVVLCLITAVIVFFFLPSRQEAKV